MLLFFFLVFLYFIQHHSVLFLSVSGLSSSQRAGTQPPLPPPLWLLHLCKDSRGREEVITTPKFLPPGSRVTTAREEREGNVPSLSHDSRRQRISTPVVSQEMRWCLLTWHRKAEGCSCVSDLAERKKKETPCEACFSSWPAHMTRVRGGGWAESSVALAKQSLTWQMVLCVLLTMCATAMILTNQQCPLAFIISACLLRLHVTAFFTLMQVIWSNQKNINIFWNMPCFSQWDERIYLMSVC